MKAYISLLLVCVAIVRSEQHSRDVPLPPLDHVMKEKFSDKFSEFLCEEDPDTFVCKWIGANGDIIDSPSRPSGEYLQVAGTVSLDGSYHHTGTEIIRMSSRNMAPDVFSTIAINGRVGLFTYEDKTTIFPEYEHLADTPECEGRCDNECSITCTGDGRKYDDLAGVGGVRATCVDDNFMCLESDPYGNTYSVLIHEWAHTVHGYGLDTQWFNNVYAAYENAYALEIWDTSSYAMTNEFEYFAEASGVYFNVNFHGSSSGGMNGCGKPAGYCESEEEARAWLASQDPQVYEILVYVWSNYDDSFPGELTVCP